MKSTFIQLGCTFIVGLLCAMTAFYSSWPSYAITALKSDQSPLGFKITTYEGNIISSIPMIGSLITTMLAGYVLEGLGRKRTKILCGLLNTVAWSLVLTARSTLQLILARFLLGLSSGLGLVVVLVFTCETTQLTIRGSAAAMSSLLYNLGVMASYVIGWFCSYDVVCYISLTTAVMFVVVVSCLKETPPYLLKIGKEKEALSALKFYRGQSETTDAILEELSYLRNQVQRGNKDADAETPMVQSEKEKLENDAANTDGNVENKNPWILLYKVPQNRRALIMSVSLVILTVSMGMVAVQTYAGQFFASAAPSLSPDLCSVILSLIMVLTSGLTVVVTDMFPRRVLMISTCSTATICLVTLGSAMRWPGAPSWVVLVAILIYCFAIQLGVINLVFVQMSETHSPQVLSTVSATVLCFMFLANFMVLFLFVPAVEHIGLDGAFFVFAVIGAITTLVAFLFMKETRHVPLEQVQKMYANGFLCKRVCDVKS